MRSRMIVFLLAWYSILMTGHWWVPSWYYANVLLLLVNSAFLLLLSVCSSNGQKHLNSETPVNFFKRVKVIPLTLVLLVGILSAIHTVHQAKFPLPEHYNGESFDISGTVCPSSFSLAPVNKQEVSVQIILFCVNEVISPNDSRNLLRDSIIRLSCYYCDFQLLPSRLYHLRIKLKFKRPLLNFHQNWPWQRQWRLPWKARGTLQLVLAEADHSYVANDFSGADNWVQTRDQAVAEQISDHLRKWPLQFREATLRQILHLPNSSSIAALLFGDRSGLANQSWQKLADSGLTHLLVISGLHLGYIVVILMFIARTTLRFFSRRLALYSSAVIISVSLMFYLSTINYGIPSLRASLAAIFAILLSLSRVRLLPSTWWLVAFLVCSLLDPFAFVSNGFWLSFAGVGVLLTLFSHRPWQSDNKIAGLWRAQVGFFIGLMSILLWMFGQVPSASIVNNLLAIPLISLILPLAMLASLTNIFIEPAGLFLFEVTDRLFDLFWWIADLGSVFPVIKISNSTAAIAIFLSLLAVPGLVHFRLPYAPAILFVVTFAAVFGLSSPSQNFSVHVLDVGQGQSVLVHSSADESETPESLIYDMGPAFSGWDSGKEIVIPAFAEYHSLAPSVFIASHDDNDHRGGLRALLENYPETPVFSGQAERLPGSRQCLPGSLTLTRKLQVRILWPIQGNNAENNMPQGLSSEPIHKNLNSDNNRSCVVRITHKQLHILLPGDLEADGQRLLLQVLAERNQLHLLKSDILLLPHHGSKNSFNPIFSCKSKPTACVGILGPQ